MGMDSSTLDMDALHQDGMMDLDNWFPDQHGLEESMQTFYDDLSGGPSLFYQTPVAKPPSLPASSHQQVSSNQQANAAKTPTKRGKKKSRRQLSSHENKQRSTFQGSSQAQLPIVADHSMSWDDFFNSHNNTSSTTDGTKVFGDCCGSTRDDDCESCSSACEGSCPSQCGESGHGVVCDDEECRTSCHDEDCATSTSLCTNADCTDDVCSGDVCVTDICRDDSCHLQPVPTVGCRPCMVQGDKDTAAVPTSFGDDETSHSANYSALSNNFEASGAYECASHNCGSFPDFSLDLPFTDYTAFQNDAWPTNPEHLLANHILHYHDPAHTLNHERPCLADHPSQLISRCSLPVFPNPETVSNDTFTTPTQATQCGFVVQDPTAFTNHIFQEHRDSLLNFALQHNQACVLPTHQHGLACAPWFANHEQIHQHDHGICNARQTPVLSMPQSPFTSVSNDPTTTATPSSPVTPPPGKGFSPLNKAKSLIKGEPISDVKVKSPAIDLRCKWVERGSTHICGQRFQTEEALHSHCKEDHLKTVQRSDGGFTCMWEGCAREKHFPQRSKLERHLQTHTLYKPVQCPQCGQWLSAQQALVQHMRTHTGQQPWKCPWPGCGSTFKQQSALTMHYRAHTGEKPLECEICGKRFSESSNLSKHRRIHNRKGQHVCGLCGKDFHRLDQLRRHLGSNHKDQAAEASKLLIKAEEEGRGRGRGRAPSRAKEESVA